MPLTVSGPLAGAVTAALNSSWGVVVPHQYGAPAGSLVAGLGLLRHDQGRDLAAACGEGNRVEPLMRNRSVSPSRTTALRG